MTAILLAPHCDDETLFAAYTCLAHRPRVVVCFYPSDGARVLETEAACDVLGCDYEQWTIPDSWGDDARVNYSLAERMRLLWAESPTHVFAPAFTEGGHEQHNAVHRAAVGVFVPTPITFYNTYRRGEGRTRGVPVPYEMMWPVTKLRAMACYKSQIALPATQPWFANDWLEEFYA